MTAPIRNKKNLETALARIDEIIDAKHGTPEYDELEVLSILVEAYEDKHAPIPPPSPVEAIKFRMDQQLGLRQTDIAGLMGGKNRASEVLAHKRPLSLRMIRNLHKHLNIPTDCLIAEEREPYVKHIGKRTTGWAVAEKKQAPYGKHMEKKAKNKKQDG
jgi:HTH-type transcriptional regulator/antitoxin HigA